MKYLFYKIENLVNGKRYIGITQNPTQRKNRHYNKLRKGEHFNSHLQNAYWKYGELNLIFEIIEEIDSNREEAYLHEKELILTMGKFPNGYNILEGGTHPISQNRKFSKDEIFEILSTKDFLPRSGTVVAEIFGHPRGTISNILAGRNYADINSDYQRLSNDEKLAIFEEFCDRTNFIEKFYDHKKQSLSRKYDEWQILMYLYQQEFHFPKTTRELIKNFGICNNSVLQQIREGKTYQDVVIKYKKMTNEEKQQLAYRYTEMYK